MEKGFVYDYLAGIEFPGFGSIYFGRIPLVPLGRWLMGVAVIFFIAGIYLNRRRRILLFEMVRFGGRKPQFWDLFPAAAAGCFGYAFCMMGLDFFRHTPKTQGLEEILILLLWLVHMMTLISIFCLLDQTASRHLAPAFLFVTEVSTYVVGFYRCNLSKYMFGNWGMYVQSSRVEKVYGFSPAAVMLFECLMITGVWRLGVVLVENRDSCL